MGFTVIDNLTYNSLIKPSLKIRILNYFVWFFAEYDIILLFTEIKNFGNNSYIKLSFNLQKDIINNLDEFSALFYPIVQFNSYSLEKLDEKKSIISYTISMERINSIKKDLLLFQHDFFFRIADNTKKKDAKNKNKGGERLPFLANMRRIEGITINHEIRAHKKKTPPSNFVFAL